MSIRSRDSYVPSRAPSMIDGFRPDCKLDHLYCCSKLDTLTTVPRRDSVLSAPMSHSMSHSGHGHDEMSQYGGIPGGHDMYDEGGPSEPRMTRLQIFMGRQIYRWPFYSIVLSLGQLLSAVSPFLFPCQRSVP